ncbi:MAG: prepilin-type N-terminal cleavage/methylation domain-containing protein [Phycisphaerales bacterium]|nr:prepilin-type N-terminal cleavage/methylation domain-containing protein [Phycisphaerales bacterium]
MNQRAVIQRRGFSLIEVVIAVIILAIAVPPMLGLLDSTAARRADAVNTTRATILASSVLEGVLADVASTDALLGMAALDDANAYLNTPTTGFVARMMNTTTSYVKYGFTYTVEIGSLVSADGTVSASSGENIFRVVTVRVVYPSAVGADFSLPISLMVTEL